MRSLASTTLAATATLAAVMACQARGLAHGALWPVGLGAILAIVAAGWAHLAVASRPISARAGERALSWLLRVAPIASIALSFADRVAFLPSAPGWLLVALGSGALLAAAAVVPRVPVVLPLAGAVLAGLALRASELATVLIEPEHADMLPLVVAAVHRLSHGQSPYATYAMPWSIPLTYLPLAWLSFAPAVLARIDPRWTSVACELALLAVLLWTARGPRATVVLLFAAWFPSSSLVTADGMTAMPVQSFALGSVVAVVAAGSRAAPVAVGLALATTPLTGALLPLAVLRWIRDGRGALARNLAIAITVALACILPWVLWSPRAFWAGPIAWFNDIDGFPRYAWVASRKWASMAGFTGTFWSLGAERLLRPLQVAGVLGILFVAHRSERRDGSAWCCAAVATLLVFLLLNVIVWPYLYEPVAVLALVAVAITARESSATEERA